MRRPLDRRARLCSQDVRNAVEGTADGISAHDLEAVNVRIVALIFVEGEDSARAIGARAREVKGDPIAHETKELGCRVEVRRGRGLATDRREAGDDRVQLNLAIDR